MLFSHSLLFLYRQQEKSLCSWEGSLAHSYPLPLVLSAVGKMWDYEEWKVWKGWKIWYLSMELHRGYGIFDICILWSLNPTQQMWGLCIVYLTFYFQSLALVPLFYHFDIVLVLDLLSGKSGRRVQRGGVRVERWILEAKDSQCVLAEIAVNLSLLCKEEKGSDFCGASSCSSFPAHTEQQLIRI